MPLLLTACQSVPRAATATQTPDPASLHLSADNLLHGFSFTGPLNEAALTPPQESAALTHRFEGRLELLSEQEGGHMLVLSGSLPAESASLPALNNQRQDFAPTS